MINRLLRYLKPISPGKIARLQLLSIKLREGDIAIDCGANVGSVTKHLFRHGATVYAFEPNPYVFKVLSKKFETNKNVHCIQKGVLDCNDSMRLYLHEFADRDQIYWSTGSSLLGFKTNVLKDKYVEVEVVDLCEFIKSLNSVVKLLKMDVEGVECRIINKIINTGVINIIDHIFVETHDHKIPELKQETNGLRDLIREKDIRKINLDWK